MKWSKEEFSRQVLAAEGSLYRVAYSILRSNEDCADAIQEGVLKAWQKQHTLREEQFFKTWLTRIVINECYQLLRRRRLEAPWQDPPEQPFIPEPEEGSAMAELHNLDEKYRLPIVLQVIEGYTSKEIGKMLGLPHATVRTRLMRGKAMLKERLKGENDHD